jgi:hypothetical protein
MKVVKKCLPEWRTLGTIEGNEGETVYIDSYISHAKGVGHYARYNGKIITDVLYTDLAEELIPSIEKYFKTKEIK